MDKNVRAPTGEIRNLDKGGRRLAKPAPRHCPRFWNGIMVTINNRLYALIRSFGELCVATHTPCFLLHIGPRKRIILRRVNT